MTGDSIEGFIVGGSTQITIANLGAGIMLTFRTREATIETMLGVEQSQRLRRLLRAAEKRAAAPRTAP